MQISFSTLLRSLLAVCLLSTNVAQAQDAASYPNKPIRLIVPVPPGGAADGMARLVADHLQTKWGQPVLVDNKPGAGSAVGLGLLAKSPPDGYTIGMGNIAANAINPALQPTQFAYQPVKDFAAITLIGVTPLILVVNADKVPSKTIPEFIAYLKANRHGALHAKNGYHHAARSLQGLGPHDDRPVGWSGARIHGRGHHVLAPSAGR